MLLRPSDQGTFSEGPKANAGTSLILRAGQMIHTAATNVPVGSLEVVYEADEHESYALVFCACGAASGR